MTRYYIRVNDINKSCNKCLKITYNKNIKKNEKMLTLSDEVNFVLLEEKDVFVFNGRTSIFWKIKTTCSVSDWSITAK